MSRTSRALLGAAILFHLLMLVSWRTGTLNALFFDAVVTHGVRGWDFYALYQAGHNVLTGHSAYESAADRIDVVIPGGTYTPFRYLPVSAYTAGVLFNLVSPRWAYRLWVAFTELVLLACLTLTWRMVRDNDRRVRLTAMWLCYTPYYLELYMGQFSFVQGALVFGMLALALRGAADWRFDGAWIGSVLWKQNTALFAPLLVRLKRWRALFLAALLVAITSLPYFSLYPGSLDAFLRNFRGEPPWFQLGNLGFRQLVFDAMWSMGDVLGVELPQAAYLGAQWAVVALFLALPLALLVFDRRLDVTLHLSLWMAAYFLIYHHVWEHHYVMLLPVLVTLMMRSESGVMMRSESGVMMRSESGVMTRRQSGLLWAIYVLLALPTPFYLIDPQGQVAVLDAMRWTPIRPLWQDLLYHASKAIPALALYGWLAWQIARSSLPVGARSSRPPRERAAKTTPGGLAAERRPAPTRPSRPRDSGQRLDVMSLCLERAVETTPGGLAAECRPAPTRTTHLGTDCNAGAPS